MDASLRQLSYYLCLRYNWQSGHRLQVRSHNGLRDLVSARKWRHLRGTHGSPDDPGIRKRHEVHPLAGTDLHFMHTLHNNTRGFILSYNTTQYNYFSYFGITRMARC